ncbi:FtsW/RodA/SpoVE family cell cycle protein [Fictibacillus nanhaiensis]|uniref:FtsW/RodA/SpoVE family cell cycle protein n=1 Tax=Fictibacillus nanhaiensis TaxID=742169 RepID=UPI003C15BCF8
METPNSKSFIDKLDYGILFILFLLSIISLMFIYSGQQSGQYNDNFVPKQIFWYTLSTILMLAIARLDFEQLKRMSWYFYGIVLFFIVMLIFAPESIAKPINGSKAWYQLPFLGSFQPSEFMKIALILVLSNIVESHNYQYIQRTIRSDLYLIYKMGLACLAPVIFVAIQPDSGMIMLYLSIILSIIFISGVSWKIILAVISLPSIVLTALIVIYFKFNNFFQTKLLVLLLPHQRSRINGWLNPFEYTDQGYQTKQAITAIGSGWYSGKGWMEGIMYVPEAHTDFIFSIIGEDTGFLGTSIVVSLFFLLIYKIVILGVKSNYSFGGYMCSGIIGLLSFQIFQNVGMNIGLLPVTGVTLPFLSYGGSSLLSNMMLMGIVLGVSVQTNRYMFEIDQ